jgi:hypothetical protein
MRFLKKLNPAKSTFTLVATLGLLLILTLPASAHGHFRGGFFYGSAYPRWGWGWYSPYYNGFGYGPYYGGIYQNTGEIKLDTDVKDAGVYINGAFAGTTGKLKTFRLKPNTYDLEIRAPGRTRYAEKIYVVAGKTLRIHPELRPEDKP